MVHRRTLSQLLGLVLIFTSAFMTESALAVEKPKFKIPAPGIVALPNANAGQPYELDLRTLLVSSDTKPLTWALTSPPGWLKLDSANHRVFGDPAQGDAGILSFRISVHDGTDGEPNRAAQVTVLAPPKWNAERLDLGIANEGKTFAYDLKSQVLDPVGGGLTFEARNLPPWMSLNPSTGVLTGVPLRPYLGAYSGITLTARGVGGSAQIEAHGFVLKTVKAPKWVKPEFELPGAREDDAYSQKVADFAVNEEGAALTFDIVTQTPPAWLAVGKTSGTLYGTPGPTNVGPIAVSVILSATIDGKLYTDTALFRLKVEHVNHPPRWLANPIRLPAGATGVLYRQDLGTSVTDPDIKGAKDKLTFTIVKHHGPGAAWATIDPQTGLLAGTPTSANVGLSTWDVVATDSGGLTDRTQVVAEIKKSNEPPYWITKPTHLKAAKEGETYVTDLSELARDPDNDALSFTAVSLPSWLTLSAPGILSGRPGAGDVGILSLTVRVSDNVSGSDTGDLKLLIEHTNHAPFWVLSPIQLRTKQEQPMDIDISPYAKDDDAGDLLVFSSIEGPPWAQLSAKGRFTGTPGVGSGGANRYRVRVADRAGAVADVDVVITVEEVNHPPKWTLDPVSLPNAREGSDYAASLANYVVDPDTGDRLTFSKLGGPAWAIVNGDGRIAGNPARKDIGLTELRVRVLDKAGEGATASVRIIVDKTNHPPRWRQNPIQLGQSGEDTAFSFDLTPYAVDDDADPLTFRLVNGPPWMNVSPAGQVGGVPTKNDLGAFTAVFEIGDGQGNTAQARGEGSIVHLNHPPVVNGSMPAFSVDERKVVQVSLNDPRYVSDPDGDTLHFSAVDTLDWVKINDAGTVTLSPRHKDVGPQAFVFRVDDGKVAVNGTMRILVAEDPRAPVWIEDPVQLSARINEPVTTSVADRARDLDGKAIVFAKKTGAAWLTVAASGALSGTPKQTDGGPNQFVLTACNDKKCAEGRLTVNVSVGTVIDRLALDAPVVGGTRTELVWVIDNSPSSDAVARAVKQASIDFYATLFDRGVRPAGVVLSSDVPKWDGLPIRGDGEPMLLPTNATDAAAHFWSRVDLAVSDGACGNCFNSPIWAFYRFLERAPTAPFSSIYKSTFFTEGTPLEVLVVTAQRDHFPRFTRSQPALSQYGADRFAQAYGESPALSSQLLRIDVIAPECPALIESSQDGSSVAPADAYHALADTTLGRVVSACDPDLRPTLRTQAERIAFRAAVHGKRRLKLSQPLLSPASLKVFVAEQELAGNHGGESDLWTYDPGTKEVLIQWAKVDRGQLKAGQEIRLQYQPK